MHTEYSRGNSEQEHSQMIARKDHDILYDAVLHIAKHPVVLPHGVRCALRRRWTSMTAEDLTRHWS